MPDFLVGFSFHEPEPFSQWQRGLIEDYESSTGLWVTANTGEEAIIWGQQVAEVLHRYVNDNPSADWRADGHSCWLEESPAESCWKHCLSYFQRVRVGEMPPLDQMDTESYIRWRERESK
jgi:hypothetical protein